MDGHVLPGEARGQLDLLHLRAGHSAGLFRSRRPVGELDHARGRYSGGAAGLAGALRGPGLANNIYTQIGLVLLIALSAKNGILIVEIAREGRAADKSILEAVVEAAQARFRPILMTSFVFILGVMPLVLATGAGASARKSLGIAVASGMLASTCLAVLFVPSFYVVLQRLAERRGAKAASAPAAAGS